MKRALILLAAALVSGCATRAPEPGTSVADHVPSLPAGVVLVGTNGIVEVMARYSMRRSG